ncbi:hypothetical protein BHE74_00032983 [Ensete ventricosum]|nr:hypothetical protein BHE74_00032983 [Ensete ventricosum]RZR82509.1 hypothetical protein BHM03_00008957 [Ensete ventricosum]
MLNRAIYYLINSGIPRYQILGWQSSCVRRGAMLPLVLWAHLGMSLQNMLALEC